MSSDTTKCESQNDSHKSLSEDNPNRIPDYGEDKVLFVKRAISVVTKLMQVCQKSIDDITVENVKVFCRINDKDKVPASVWSEITKQIKLRF